MENETQRSPNAATGQGVELPSVYTSAAHETGIAYLRHRYRAEKKAGNDAAAERIHATATAQEIPYSTVVRCIRQCIAALVVGDTDAAAAIHAASLCFHNGAYYLPVSDTEGRIVRLRELPPDELPTTIRALQTAAEDSHYWNQYINKRLNAERGRP